MARVLFIEKQPDLSTTFQTYLELRGYVVQTASDGAAALDAIATEPPDVLFLDLSVLRGHSLDVLQHISTWAPGVNVFVVSDHVDGQTREQVYSCGARACLQKPVTLGQLQSCVTYTLTRSSTPPRWH